MTSPQYEMDEAGAMLDPMPVPVCRTGALLKAALRKSLVLQSLENIIKFDDDRLTVKAATRRYLDLTNPGMEPDL